MLRFLLQRLLGHPPAPIFGVCGTEHGSQYPPTPPQALNVAHKVYSLIQCAEGGNPNKGLTSRVAPLGATLCVRSGCGPTQGIALWRDDLAESAHSSRPRSKRATSTCSPPIKILFTGSSYPNLHLVAGQLLAVNLVLPTFQDFQILINVY